MNKHILMVMKWLNDKNSVTQEDLISNRKSVVATGTYYGGDGDSDSDSVAVSVATATAYRAADALAAYAAYAADTTNTEYWVNKYFKRTGENKDDYIKELNK